MRAGGKATEVVRLHISAAGGDALAGLARASCGQVGP